MVVQMIIYMNLYIYIFTYVFMSFLEAGIPYQSLTSLQHLHAKKNVASHRPGALWATSGRIHQLLELPGTTLQAPQRGKDDDKTIDKYHKILWDSMGFIACTVSDCMWFYGILEDLGCLVFRQPRRWEQRYGTCKDMFPPYHPTVLRMAATWGRSGYCSSPEQTPWCIIRCNNTEAAKGGS